MRWCNKASRLKITLYMPPDSVLPHFVLLIAMQQQASSSSGFSARKTTCQAAATC
jgi:hypothetical protein